MAQCLEILTQFTGKLKQLCCFRIIYLAKWGRKKTGEQFAFRGQTAPLTRGGLERKKRHKPYLSKIRGETPEGHSTLKNINELLILG